MEARELPSTADGAADLLMECDEEEQQVWPPSPQRHEEEEEDEGHDEALAAAMGSLEEEESDLRPVQIIHIPVQPVGGCSPPTQNNPLQSSAVPLGFKVNGLLVRLLPGGGAAELKLCSHPGGSASGFTTVQIHSPSASQHMDATAALTAAEADPTPIITGVVSGEAAQKVLSVHSVNSESISPPLAPVPPRASPVPVSVPSPWTLVPLETKPSSIKPTAPHKLLHRGQLGPVSPPDCCVCLSQFKLVTELRGFMCLCSPAIAQSLKILKKKKKKKKKKKLSRRSRDKHKKSKSPRDPHASRKESRPPPGASTSKVTSPVQRPYRPPDNFLSDRLSPPIPPCSPERDRPDSPPEPLHGKLVIMVEDFYYGSAPGRSITKPKQPDRRFTGPFRCISCPKSLRNNIKLMSHMKQHVSSTLGGDVSVCPHCYRHFLSPFKLQCHVEAVHSQYQSTAKCRICELDFGSEATFLWHMKSTHKPGEMPYVCQVCDFRSSFYSDVWSHFHQVHADGKHLMCQYCLRVMRSNACYQQHFARHQKKHVFGCEKCRLHFLYVRERIEHRLDHGTHVRPPQLLGLKPGTKVTVRTYSVAEGSDSKEKVKKAVAPCKVEDVEPSPPTQDAPKRKPVKSLGALLSAISQESVSGPSPLCVECLSPVQDFSSHFPSLVHCSLCGFVTCCATSYANHMISNHATSRKKIPPYLSIFHTNPRLSQKLRCVSCTFTTCRGDAMAHHLTEKPEHRCIALTHNKLGVNGPQTQNQQPSHNPRSVTSSEGGAFIPIHLVPSIQTSTQLSVKPLSSPSPLSSRPAMTIKFLGPRPQTDQRPPSPLTASQLAVVLSSLCHGVPEACRRHQTTPLTVRLFMLQQRRQLWDRKWCWRSDKLAEWVLSQREQQLSLSEDALLQTARTALGEDAEPADRYSWTVDFMLRHQLGLQPAKNSEQRRGRLPRSVRDNCRSFIRSLSTQIQSRRVPPRCVGSMDEFSVFIDSDRFSDQDPSALRLSGSPEDEPVFDVVLSALSDGTLLPPLLFFRGAASHLPDGFPDNVLLQARQEGFKDSERLNIWIDQVWRPRVVSQCNGECVLLLDVHRGHVTDEFRASLTSVSTGVAFIPPGCCCRLQPLNICVTPVLRDFLQARWTQLVSDGGLDGLGLDQLALTLACWLSEVSSTLNSETHILHRSFASVCSEQPVEDGDEAARMIAALSAALVQPPDASKAQQEAEPQMEVLLVMEGEEGGVEEEALHRGFYGDSDNESFLSFIDD